MEFVYNEVEDIEMNKETWQAFLKEEIKKGNACSCCDHNAGYSWCPICEKKTTRTDEYGGCFRCGNGLVKEGETGIMRVFGESDDEWQKRLKAHQAEKAK
jgi:hypothetical protein